MCKRKATPLKGFPLLTKHEHGILCAAIDRESTNEQKLHLLLPLWHPERQENTSEHAS
jgi:hypothetical protein